MFGATYIWATDLATGQPAPNLNVTLYEINSGAELGSGVTDGDGLVSFSYSQQESYLQGVVAVSLQLLVL